MVKHIDVEEAVTRSSALPGKAKNDAHLVGRSANAGPAGGTSPQPQLVSEEKGRCCCGRFVNDYLPVIINNKMHELLGTPGAFCGPVINHQLRDAQAELEKARERIKNDWDDLVLPRDDTIASLRAENERLRGLLLKNTERWAHCSVDRAAVENQLAQQHYCHAHSDGDCTWEHCPQLRDGEPEKSGRHCPLDVLQNEREEWQEREEQLRARIAEQDEALCDAERTIGNGVTQLERLERERGRLESENERLNGAYETAHASRLHTEDCLTRAERDRDEKHYAANLAERDRDAAREQNCLYKNMVDVKDQTICDQAIEIDAALARVEKLEKLLLLWKRDAEETLRHDQLAVDTAFALADDGGDDGE